MRSIFLSHFKYVDYTLDAKQNDFGAPVLPFLNIAD